MTRSGPSEELLRDGRTTSSHTVGIEHLSELLATLAVGSDSQDYEHAVVAENVFARPTKVGRQRTLRHLRELYVLDPRWPPFRALRQLWQDDLGSGPLLAGLLAVTRDGLLRASAAAVIPVPAGTKVTPGDLAAAVEAGVRHNYSSATLAKIGRNTAASWAQIGHLTGRTRKVRRRVTPTHAVVTYALLLGHLGGIRGEQLFDTIWTALLDTSPIALRELASEAARLGYLDLRSAGDVVEVGFPYLLPGAAT